MNFFCLTVIGHQQRRLTVFRSWSFAINNNGEGCARPWEQEDCFAVSVALEGAKSSFDSNRRESSSTPVRVNLPAHARYSFLSRHSNGRHLYRRLGPTISRRWFGFAKARKRDRKRQTGSAREARLNSIIRIYGAGSGCFSVCPLRRFVRSDCFRLIAARNCFWLFRYPGTVPSYSNGGFNWFT